MSSWNDSLHFCWWDGVTCGRRHSSHHLRSFVERLSRFLGKPNLLKGSKTEEQREGKIPPEVGRLVRLQQLRLYNNSFDGEIPANISHCSKLQHFALPGNRLVGNTFGQLRNLSFLGFAKNNLSGRIPPSVYNISLLTVFLLSFNQFDGSLPPGFGMMLPHLQVFNLYQNNLAGPLPSGPEPIFWTSLSRDWQARSLTSENGLSGEIPSSLGDCTSLETIYFERNFFQGFIPPSLQLLRGLSILGLSHNNLTGHIPRFLEHFALNTLDLSFNNFDDEVPTKGALANLSVIALVGDNRLCGGVPELQLPNCTIKGPKTYRKLSLALTLVISIGCAVVGFNLWRSLLLLEMLTGKTPTDPMFQESLDLHRYAQTALPDNIMEIVEPILASDDEEEPAAAVSNNRSRAKRRDCLVFLIKIGLSCSVKSPQDRTEISSAIHELNSVRSFLQTTRD
ncbi:hypothetical protein RJ640_005930 [Escallonia rubra]|uniref:Leucine-rich repeat-containing N-terminal plant-type domain-containing protein n=1 Tax=Escallonia rubra TaxID=112253 RepID=A0AA88R7X1_9ASTE|nr:hypothetical protein RJ640_005930 [Escallonia rubra]